jgi:hypothetical protein
MACGSRLAAGGWRLAARGLWLVVRGSRLVVRGAWCVVRGSWLGCGTSGVSSLECRMCRQFSDTGVSSVCRHVVQRATRVCRRSAYVSSGSQHGCVVGWRACRPVGDRCVSSVGGRVVRWATGVSSVDGVSSAGRHVVSSVGWPGESTACGRVVTWRACRHLVGVSSDGQHGCVDDSSACRRQAGRGWRFAGVSSGGDADVSAIRGRVVGWATLARTRFAACRPLNNPGLSRFGGVPCRPLGNAAVSSVGRRRRVVSLSACRPSIGVSSAGFPGCVGCWQSCRLLDGLVCRLLAGVSSPGWRVVGWMTGVCRLLAAVSSVEGRGVSSVCGREAGLSRPLHSHAASHPRHYASAPLHVRTATCPHRYMSAPRHMRATAHAPQRRPK